MLLCVLFSLCSVSALYNSTLFRSLKQGEEIMCVFLWCALNGDLFYKVLLFVLPNVINVIFILRRMLDYISWELSLVVVPLYQLGTHSSS